MSSERCYSYGTSALALTVDDYDALLDRGWMRSGTFLYHPSNKTACCPNLAIKIDVARFQSSRSHKKTLRRFEQVLLGKRPIRHVVSPRPENKLQETISRSLKQSAVASHWSSPVNSGAEDLPALRASVIWTFLEHGLLSDVERADSSFSRDPSQLRAAIHAARESSGSPPSTSWDVSTDLPARLHSMNLTVDFSAEATSSPASPFPRVKRQRVGEDPPGDPEELPPLSISACAANLLKVMQTLFSEVSRAHRTLAHQWRVTGSIGEDGSLLVRLRHLVDPPGSEREDSVSGLREMVDSLPQRQQGSNNAAPAPDAAWTKEEEAREEAERTMMEWEEPDVVRMRYQQTRDPVRLLGPLVGEGGERRGGEGQAQQDGTEQRPEEEADASAGYRPRRLEVRLEPAKFSEEMYQLYFRFNTEIHDAKPSETDRESFERHLCTSPLLPEPGRSLPPECLQESVRECAAAPLRSAFRRNTAAVQRQVDERAEAHRVKQEAAMERLRREWERDMEVLGGEGEDANAGDGHAPHGDDPSGVMQHLRTLLRWEQSESTGHPPPAPRPVSAAARDAIKKEALARFGPPLRGVLGTADIFDAVDNVLDENPSREPTLREVEVSLLSLLGLGEWMRHASASRQAAWMEAHMENWMWAACAHEGMDTAQVRSENGLAHIFEQWKEHHRSAESPITAGVWSGFQPESSGIAMLNRHVGSVEESFRGPLESEEQEAAPCDRDSAATSWRMHSAEKEGFDLRLGYGTFFHKYYIDGVLVAVSSIDILPRRLASVYFFYNPDLRHLELGKYSALREIALAHRMSHVSPALRWVDLNYYVHDCTKMNYKSAYRPSFLLCPTMHVWVPLEQAVKRLDEDKYADLFPCLLDDASREEDAAESSSFGTEPDLELGGTVPTAAERIHLGLEEGQWWLGSTNEVEFRDFREPQVCPFMDSAAAEQAVHASSWRVSSQIPTAEALVAAWESERLLLDGALSDHTLDGHGDQNEEELARLAGHPRLRSAGLRLGSVISPPQWMVRDATKRVLVKVKNRDDFLIFERIVQSARDMLKETAPEFVGLAGPLVSLRTVIEPGVLLHFGRQKLQEKEGEKAAR